MSGEGVPSNPKDDAEGRRELLRLEQEAIDRMRVDLSKVCADRAGRSRVYAILLHVDRWGLLRDIGPHIRVEKGALNRGLRVSEGLYEPCAKAIQTGMQLFDELEFEVRRVAQGGAQFVQVAAQPTAYEQIVLGGLQRWLDALAASQMPMNGFMLEMIAGFAGCDVGALRRFGASTGVEAAWRVGWSVRHAIAQEMPHPFAWLGLFEEERRQSMPATGRPCPVQPAETAWDDRAILLAVADGATKPKAIFGKVLAAGADLKQLRIRQRKQDLVRWGLLEPESGVWRLTEQGKAWVRELGATHHRTTK